MQLIFKKTAGSRRHEAAIFDELAFFGALCTESVTQQKTPHFSNQSAKIELLKSRDCSILYIIRNKYW